MESSSSLGFPLLTDSFSWPIDTLPQDRATERRVVSFFKERIASRQYPQPPATFSFGSTRYYCPKAPVKDAKEDSRELFIQRLAEQRIGCLVNLMEPNEGKGSDLFAYWPNEGEELQFNAWSIRNEGEIDTYVEGDISYRTTRKLLIRSEDTCHRLTQIHLRHWEDGGPCNPALVKMVLEEVDRYYDGREPLGVHCKASRGRTGTFLVCREVLNVIREQQREKIANPQINYVDLWLQLDDVRKMIATGKQLWSVGAFARQYSPKADPLQNPTLNPYDAAASVADAMIWRQVYVPTPSKAIIALVEQRARFIFQIKSSLFDGLPKDLIARFAHLLARRVKCLSVADVLVKHNVSLAPLDDRISQHYASTRHKGRHVWHDLLEGRFVLSLTQVLWHPVDGSDPESILVETQKRPHSR